MNYIVFSISTAFFFALTIFLRKLAGKEISIYSAYLIETLMQMAIMIIVFFLLSPEFKKGLDFKTKGLAFATLAGITIVIGVLSNYLALKSGLFSKVVSITSPGQIIFGVLLGIFLASDSLSLKQIIGIIISVVGMYLVIVK